MAMSRAEAARPFRERPRLDRAGGVLVGSRCGDCGAQSWPGRAVCSRCGSDDVVTHALPDVGTLTSYTRVWVERPGLPTPYVLGQVDLGRGATVFAHLRGLPDGAEVPLEVRPVLAADPAAVPRFWFEPA